MKFNVKFKFHLKNGKVFECIEEVTKEQFVKVVGICKTAMQEGVDGMLTFPDCVVRLSEVAVMEWEEIE